MPILLRSDIHAAIVDDDVVLLDVASDNYLCLLGHAVAWRAGVGEDGAVQDPDLGERLAAAGLTGRGLGSPRGRAPPIPQVSVCGEPPVARLRLREASALAGAMVDVLLHYRGRSLAHILGFVRRRPAGGTPSQAEVLRLSAAFARIVVWLPLPAKCLVRSFALLRFLQRQGQDATWCFGVRTWPFSAHCWLQAGDVALDDHADQLRAYTPIHAV